jgi:hypothetical protein
LTFIDFMDLLSISQYCYFRLYFLLRTYSKEMAELSESDSEEEPGRKAVSQATEQAKTQPNEEVSHPGGFVPIQVVLPQEQEEVSHPQPEEAAPDEAKAQPKPAEVAQQLVQVAVAVEHYP